MKIQGWGMYPKIDAQCHSFRTEQELKEIVLEKGMLIPFGNGRSYGDSALNDNIVDVKSRKYILAFNETTGLLHVEAGVILNEILECFCPRGWFIKVTPGTKFISIGGAIASDVHGKNHHLDGCFSECVEELRLMLPDGEIVTCSKHENTDLFRATCGGMGLTGIILDAKIQLKKINSVYVNQTTIKTSSLEETFKTFEELEQEVYTVAWIDCLAKGKSTGRSLIMAGDFCDDGDLDYKNKGVLNVPFNFPSFALNTLSVKVFNWLYYGKVRSKRSCQRVGLDSFFYPLDSILNWNRIYGKNGFTQYQFILPKETSYQGLTEILNKISSSGKGSFLAVLKLYGPENENFLSFPFEGFGLALDFKIDQGVFELLDDLDELVLKFGGRIYLAKDVRMSAQTFAGGYPHVDKFKELRKKYKMDKKFESLQSRRVKI